MLLRHRDAGYIAGGNYAGPSVGALSGALVRLVEPYRAEAQSYSAYGALVAFGSLAWNLSLSPASERAPASKRLSAESRLLILSGRARSLDS